MLQQRSKGATAFMLLTCLVAWFALALQLYLMIDNTPGNGLSPWQAVARFLIFFTVLTNLLIAFSLSCVLWAPRSRLGNFFSRPASATAIAVYIFIVALVYNVILRSMASPTGWSKVADELLHVVVPVLYLLYWLLIVPKGFLKWINPFLYWWIYPALYLVYALWRGNMEGFYAYPFINVAKLGYSKVLLNAGGVVLLFIATSLLFTGIDKWMAKSKP